MDYKMTVRDLLAVPFWFLAIQFDWLALKIGGVWTAQMFREHAELVKEKHIIDEWKRRNNKM